MLKNLTKIVVDDPEICSFTFDKLLDDFTVESEHPYIFTQKIYRDYVSDLYAPQVAYLLFQILGQDAVFSRPLNNIYVILEKKDLYHNQELFWIIRMKNGSQIISSPAVEYLALIKNNLESIYTYEFPTNTTRLQTSLQKKALLASILLESRDIELTLEQVRLPIFENDTYKVYFSNQDYTPTKLITILSLNIPFHEVQSYQTLKLQISDSTLLQLKSISKYTDPESLDFGDYFAPTLSHQSNQEQLTRIIRVASEKQRMSTIRIAVGETVQILSKS